MRELGPIITGNSLNTTSWRVRAFGNRVCFTKLYFTRVVRSIAPFRIRKTDTTSWEFRDNAEFPSRNAPDFLSEFCVYFHKTGKYL